MNCMDYYIYADVSVDIESEFMEENDEIYIKEGKIHLKINDSSSFLKKMIINSVKNIKFVKI